ncbi:hypothetical protein [Metabacillus sp. FJAT-53654]|uniref:HTH cro/C1-type domain-containing protein n=1 Tax=Metabacillus rhizosphaerae TaxID=3117747 RepID=A0ABZ2MP79_9BACI
MTIGKRLKDIRVSKGLTLKEVENALSITSLHGLEQGKYKSFKCEHLVILSEFYNISPLYLLGLEEDTFNIESKWLVLIQKLKQQNISPRDVMKSVEKYKNISISN